MESNKDWWFHGAINNFIKNLKEQFNVSFNNRHYQQPYSTLLIIYNSIYEKVLKPEFTCIVFFNFLQNFSISIC